MSKLGALKELEAAFRNWYWETDTDMPDIGVLVIGLSRQGVDLQFLGQEPDGEPDWPLLFRRIIQELESGRYSVNRAAEVPFEGQR